MKPLPRREMPRFGALTLPPKRRPAVTSERDDRFETVNRGDRGDSDRLSTRSHRDQ